MYRKDRIQIQRKETIFPHKVTTSNTHSISILISHHAVHIIFFSFNNISGDEYNLAILL